jgi:transcriptional regulator with XRE-family HTH domain
VTNDPQLIAGTLPHTTAAVLDQHRLIQEVRSKMAREELGWDFLGAQLGVSEEQARRLMRGESELSLARMYQLAAIVDLSLVVDVRRATTARQLGDPEDQQSRRGDL